MLRSLFAYDLPESLIARYPAAQRTGSRLLQLDGASGAVKHSQFTALPSCLRKGDLLVFNNTRVLPARLLGEKATGGKVEVLIERVVDAHSALAHIRASKAPTSGTPLFIYGLEVEGVVQRHELRVEGRQHDLFRVRTVGNASILTLMQDAGHMPLPPYIDRADEVMDRERYQTVYAQNPGAVAAPTAGLHFDQAMLDALRANGIDTAFVTLHVGAGTFQPVRAENILEHNMHREWMQVDAGVCAQVAATRSHGGRVIAVGTTAVRCLESASATGELQPFNGDTAIFIYPGYSFRSVDALLTNFHLSESTLLMLVCAFAGYQHTMAAYRAAIEQQYRFFSYGDAMFVTHNTSAPQAVFV